MQWFLVFLKIDPNKTNNVQQTINKWPKNPEPHINLYYAMNIFGPWDACVWFEADNHNNAMNFVQRHIRTIPGVTETQVMPATPIKEYRSK